MKIGKITKGVLLDVKPANKSVQKTSKSSKDVQKASKSVQKASTSSQKTSKVVQKSSAKNTRSSTKTNTKAAVKPPLRGVNNPDKKVPYMQGKDIYYSYMFPSGSTTTLPSHLPAPDNIIGYEIIRIENGS